MKTTLYRSCRLFGITALRQEWCLLLLCIVLSLALAFRSDVETAKWAISSLGYWQMWLVVAIGVAFLAKDTGGDAVLVARWWRCGHRRRGLLLAGCLVAVAVFSHLHFRHGFKILADEAVLANTSQALHQHRHIYTPANAEYRNGIFVVSSGFIDKRPYFHPFAVSVLHDLTGYRWNNAVWLNALLTLPIVCSFFFIGRRLNRRWGGGLAVLLAAGVPIFGQALTGGGFEPLNLLLLLLSSLAAIRAWERPTAARISLLLVSGLLLAYTRYESGLYLVPVGLVLWCALRRSTSGHFPWLLYAVPILCAPLVWLQMIAFSDEYRYFQLSIHDDPSAFSAAFFGKNLRSAYDFFLLPSEANLSSPLISVAGVFGALGLGYLVLRRGIRHGADSSRVPAVLALFGLATCANMVVFLFFNYGQYAEYITQRISVPVYAYLVVGATALFALFPRRIGGWLAAGCAMTNFVLFYLPCANGDYQAGEYIPAKDMEFVRDVSQRVLEPAGVLVYSHVPMYWMSMRRPSIGFKAAVQSEAEIYPILERKQYDRILVHLIEFPPGVDVPKDYAKTPPQWFSKVGKRVVARRWYASGVVGVVYEILLPDRNGGGPVLPPAPASGHSESH